MDCHIYVDLIMIYVESNAANYRGTCAQALPQFSRKCGLSGISCTAAGCCNSDFVDLGYPSCILATPEPGVLFNDIVFVVA